MLLGAHESAAGGCHGVFERCARDGAEAVQLWTRSARKWASRPLDDHEVTAFRAAHRAFSRPNIPTAAHAAYLINLASGTPEIRARSIATLLDECLRAERLGVDHVILHVGASKGDDVGVAIGRVSAALREVVAALPAGARVRILVELTAGQGSSIGSSFEQLDAVLQATGEARLGVCLDTQHMFAAGIDWTSARGYARTFRAFERVVGLAHLEAFHLNDSKTALGSRVDRHAPIGHGVIGVAPFGRLVRDPRFARLPGYLETPPLPSGEESYGEGIALLRALRSRARRDAGDQAAAGTADSPRLALTARR